jgi:hypothetical protein
MLSIAARCYVNPAHEGWARALVKSNGATLQFDDRDDFDRLVQREWGEAARVVACEWDTPRSDVGMTLETGRPVGGVHPLPPGPMKPGIYVFVLVSGPHP